MLVCSPVIFAFSSRQGKLQTNSSGTEQIELNQSQVNQDTIKDQDTIPGEVFFIVEEMPEFQGKDIEF